MQTVRILLQPLPETRAEIQAVVFLRGIDENIRIQQPGHDAAPTTSESLRIAW